MDKYIGKRLDGRYEIKEIIGVGGMAYVYKAYDTIDDRVVAIKILKDEFLANEEFTRRFKNESKAIAILSHPNIVKVYDVSFGARLQYIVMEYIDGITLKEYIEQQQDIKWKEAVHFTVQILRALQHAHDKGIVHRDIKPQNIMLLPDGTIKVTDFGIARFSRQDIRATSATDKAIGSVHYISPEQARGEITDEKADIYSVGVMLYEMLTGRLPFEADNAVSVAIMQLQSEPKMPRDINPSIPEGLEEITIKAMQKDPSKRYQSAAEMLLDIDEFKRNPSIHFEYKYFRDETPTRFVEAITKVKGEPLATEEPEPEEEEEEEEEERKGPPVLSILMAIAGAFVLVTLIFVAIVLINLFFPKESAGNEGVIPTFEGLNYDEQISNNPEWIALFDFAEPVYMYDDAPKGTVLRQKPAAGSTYKTTNKQEIQLWISNGPKMVPLPNVVGLHQDDAREQLRNSGFEVNISLLSSDEVQKDFVIRTLPVSYPNELVEGSQVTIVVSTGEEPVPDKSVPNIKETSLDQARDRLSQEGFVVDTAKIVYQNHPTYAAGTVISQSPAGDTLAKAGSEVILTVSTGYRDLTLTVPLPSLDDAIDMKIYIDGIEQTGAAYTKFKGILPNVMRSVDIPFTEQKASYRVSIRVARSGSLSYETYAEYTVDGTRGRAEQNLLNKDVLASPATSTPTTKPTEPASSTPDRPDRQSD